MQLHSFHLSSVDVHIIISISSLEAYFVMSISPQYNRDILLLEDNTFDEIFIGAQDSNSTANPYMTHIYIPLKSGLV